MLYGFQKQCMAREFQTLAPLMQSRLRRLVWQSGGTSQNQNLTHKRAVWLNYQWLMCQAYSWWFSSKSRYHRFSFPNYPIEAANLMHSSSSRKSPDATMCKPECLKTARHAGRRAAQASKELAGENGITQHPYLQPSFLPPTTSVPAVSPP